MSSSIELKVEQNGYPFLIMEKMVGGRGLEPLTSCV
jgi:hypothetical protein